MRNTNQLRISVVLCLFRACCFNKQIPKQGMETLAHAKLQKHGGARWWVFGGNLLV